MNKALFLDRDGTLIYDKNYLADPDQVELIPGTTAALRRALELGYLLFLFTNQSGISRKYFSRHDVDKIHERMEDLLALPRPLFTEICVAPEMPDEQFVYRKPSPRFILEMIKKYNLDPDGCYMVGDAPSDIMAGINAGIAAVAVTTGKKEEHPSTWPEVTAAGVRVFASLYDFVKTL